MEMKKFSTIVNNINCMIARNLRRTSTTSASFSLDVSIAFKNYMIEHYDITKRFQPCPDFSSDFGLISEHHHQPQHYIQVANFQIKLCIERKENVKENVATFQVKYGPKIAIKFSKKKHVPERNTDFLLAYHEARRRRN